MMKNNPRGLKTTGKQFGYDEPSGQQPITISLADVGVAVPETATVDVTIVGRGLEISRRDETFILERDGTGYALTGVVGRDELPERVPDWIGPVAAWFGIAEVTLGR